MIWTIWFNAQWEREFRDSGSNANTKICFEVGATALRPHLHTEGFSQYVHTGPSTKGPPLRNYNSTLGVHYSSLKHNHLYIRGISTKPKHNHLYTRGIKHKAKAQTQSSLHKRDMHKAKAQTQSPLHKREMHKAKSKKRLQSWWPNDHKQHLVIIIDHK